MEFSSAAAPWTNERETRFRGTLHYYAIRSNSHLQDSDSLAPRSFEQDFTTDADGAEKEGLKCRHWRAPAFSHFLPDRGLPMASAAIESVIRSLGIFCHSK